MNEGLLIVLAVSILGWLMVFTLEKKSRRNRFTVGCPRCEDCLHLEGGLDIPADQRVVRQEMINLWMNFHREMCGTVETSPTLHARIMGHDLDPVPEFHTQITPEPMPASVGGSAGTTEHDTVVTAVPTTETVDTRGALNT